MSSAYRKIFLFSLFFYLVTTAFVRFEDFYRDSPMARILSALPWDAFPLNYLEGRNSISTEIGVLSSAEVARLLETSYSHSPYMHSGMSVTKNDFSHSHKEYLVLRLQGNRSAAYTFDIKYYFSCFPYSVSLQTALPYAMDPYCYIIIPYPSFLEENSKEPCNVFLRWKRFSSHFRTIEKDLL
jgi:hypothetical protein